MGYVGIEVRGGVREFGFVSDLRLCHFRVLLSQIELQQMSAHSSSSQYSYGSGDNVRTTNMDEFRQLNLERAVSQRDHEEDVAVFEFCCVFVILCVLECPWKMNHFEWYQFMI